ncbi:hypothetical protein [Nitrososphaera sp.]|uniref:hypothetical protein n=1 Tax=Nitrososphaera sp. TaxID=1971748 RepID=UPI00307D2EB5
MPVVADSYMGLFLPADISGRITRFLAGEATFPYIKKEELIGAFFIFGKDYRVQDSEVKEARDLARRTVEQFARDVRMYSSTPGRLDPAFTRENYTKRMLQITVDARGETDNTEMGRRVAGDPTILTDCFAQHVAHYKHDFYFEIFGPLQKQQVPFPLRKKLEGRMLLLGYSARSARELLPYASSLEPFFAWLSKV